MSGPQVLAHRGARAVAPENTVAAFVRARALGADGIELDVRRSADGAMVLSHDPVVDGVGALVELELAELRRRCPEMPTLGEALDACSGLLVNVEIKNFPGDPDHDPGEHLAGAVVDLLAARDRRDRVLVSSFSLDTIDRLRRLDTSIPTGFLVGFGFDLARALELASDRGHRAVHPFVGSLPDPVAEATAEHAHRLGLDLNVWTVNDAAEMRRLAGAGVDAIITDVPDVARAALDSLV